MSRAGADLVHRVWRVNMLNLALGHRTFEAEAATFVVDPAHPGIYDANFIYDAEASTDEQIDRLLARAFREYGHCPKLTFRLAPWSSPLLESRLGLLGSEQSRTLAMVLVGELEGSARPHDLRPIDADGWHLLRDLKRIDWDEHVATSSEPSRGWEVPNGLAAVAQLKCPPVQYTFAYVDGRAVGYCNSWAGEDGIGQVEDLFVLSDYRHRGIATALLHHGVAEARRQGAGPVAICANLSDTPKSMYAAMGWRPLAVIRQYAVAVSA